ncbi:HAMP domain-containing sensor histidine kinase [Anaerosporobacter sp.]|uniref:HAMP domain-containing sensor histidine kinase n=1 Tax=Anaerosporobacter sp. TaxID=1872529 RepID=UPI00286F984C|nr:HAMP domain-containing sensor histidine kinase [Anaerosporobacter sp.]
MKHRIIGITMVFTAIIVGLIVTLFVSQKRTNIADENALQIIALNEIDQLVKRTTSESDNQKIVEISEKITQLEENMNESSMNYNNSEKTKLIIYIGVAVVAFIWITFGYIYFAILKPFDRMKSYAANIAKGDFDTSLNYERSNYFGDFTWAFDNMRQEITKSRSCEREAIENNKTVIATLSHDIKTPIASIRAYSEGLEANLDCNSEKRVKYLEVIMRKCDEVAKLTNDLFLHSLADLDKLKISLEPIEICGFLSEIIEEISAERNDVFVQTCFDTAIINADKNRFTQLVENIINNARKYAKTKVDVTIEIHNDGVTIRFRDYGEGISDEDMPFIFDKFYRGKNCGDEQGSGLGLYIVKYIAEQMNGSVMLKNHVKGLEVILNLLRIS